MLKLEDFKKKVFNENDLRKLFGGATKSILDGVCLDYIDDCKYTTWCDGTGKDDTNDHV